jgi:hypothetical protein
MTEMTKSEIWENWGLGVGLEYGGGEAFDADFGALRRSPAVILEQCRNS